MNRFLAIIILVHFTTNTGAQDILFAQQYAAPLHLNPSLTGGFGAKYRVSAIYRDQWRGPLERSISSFGAGLDLRFDINEGIFSNDAFGVGLLFLSDQASAVDLSTNVVALSGAFHKLLARNQKQYISAGFQLLTGQRNILYEDLYFQDQFDGLNSFDQPTSEDLPVNNFSYGDFAVGINFVSATSAGIEYYTGASMFHVLEPSFSFYAKDPDEIQQDKSSSKLDRRYTVHAGSTIRTGDNLRLSPRLLFHSQGESMRGMAGLNLIIEPSRTDAFNFHLGSWIALVRDFDGGPTPEAVGLLAGFGMGELLVGLSYDFNIRDIINYNTGQGTFEISVTYMGNYEEDGGLCPTF